MKLADYTLTEGGFATDLGFEKFVFIVTCQYGTIPSAVVLIVTVHALHIHGGVTSVDEVQLCTGARFIVLVCGNMFVMPSLPPELAAERMDYKDDGKIIGLN